MNISEYKKLAESYNPCQEGLSALMECGTRMDVFDLSVNPLCYDFFLRSIKKGWGPTPEDIQNVFSPYINGGRRVKCGKDKTEHLCEMWSGNGELSVSDELRRIVLIGWIGDVIVGEWQTVKIITDKNSKINVHCGDNAIAFIENYGGEVNVCTRGCRVKNL